MDAIRALLKQINTYWAGKDARFKRTVVIAAVVLAAVIIVGSVLLNQVPYATLYAGLDAQDSAAVIDALDAQNEPRRVTGDKIEVPAKDADELRLTLSTQISTGFNLDILNQGSGLGVTESQRQDFRRYQIQSDLQNSLRTLKGIKDAKVVLTMPADSVLAVDPNKQEATAGVILTLDSGYELTAEQAKGIAEFVAKGVPGLKIENISMMDSNSQMLDFSGTDDSANTSDHYALQGSVEKNLKTQLMNLLIPIFGMGRVEAEVNATLDFSDVSEDSVTYVPLGNDKAGVIASEQKLKEQIVNGSSSGSEPGTDPNTGATSSATGTPTYPAVNVDNGTYEKNEDTVNYEISQVNKHLQQAKGAIKSLSVSVVIDSNGLKDDLSENVKNLVKNAVGASVDNISVEYMPMKGAQDLSSAIDDQTKAQTVAAASQQNRFYIVIGAILLVLVTALLVFLGRRPKKAETAREAASAYAVPAAFAEGMGEMTPTEAELEAIRIVKDSSAKEQIGKLIEKNPELVANLLRSWLADDQE